MIQYYLTLALGIFLAQFALFNYAVFTWYSKNDKINYRKTALFILNANVARYALVLASTFVVMFILSDFMDLSLTKHELRLIKPEERTKIQIIQIYFRTVTIIIGTFIELLYIVGYKIGLNKILNYGKANGVADTVDTPNANG